MQVKELIEKLKEVEPERELKYNTEGKWIISDFVYISTDENKYGRYAIINFSRNVR
jgi:hypothetical protein